jgi:hypothetical protein
MVDAHEESGRLSWPGLKDGRRQNGQGYRYTSFQPAWALSTCICFTRRFNLVWPYQHCLPQIITRQFTINRSLPLRGAFFLKNIFGLFIKKKSLFPLLSQPNPRPLLVLNGIPLVITINPSSTHFHIGITTFIHCILLINI